MNIEKRFTWQPILKAYKDFGFRPHSNIFYNYMTKETCLYGIMYMAKRPELTESELNFLLTRTRDRDPRKLFIEIFEHSKYYISGIFMGFAGLSTTELPQPNTPQARIERQFEMSSSSRAVGGFRNWVKIQEEKKNADLFIGWLDGAFIRRMLGENGYPVQD